MYFPYFSYGCNFEINAERTRAYLGNAGDVCDDGDMGHGISLTCNCPSLGYILPDEPDGSVVAATYTNPITDQAPWYDSDVPESGQFLGFLVNEVSQSVVTQRSVTTRVSTSGGAIIGPLRNKERRYEFTVLMFACNELAMEYGMRYLTDVMSTGGCDDGCTLCDAEFRDSCPTISAPTYDEVDRGRWILKNVGCVSGPEWGEPPVPGLACNVRRVKFTIVSEYPWKFKCPVTECDDLALAAFPGWAGGCTNAEEFFCEQQYTYCSVAETRIVGETALIISVKAGSVPLEHINIAITPDKFGYECVPGDRPPGYVLQTPCDQISIPWIPAGATIVYDTSTESVTLNPAGGGSIDGTAYISTVAGYAPTFPTLKCGTFCIRIGVSECSVQGSPTMTVQSVHREI